MRFGLFAVALLLLGVAPASARMFPFPYQLHTLDNGLKVYFIPMQSQGLSAYYTVVRTGSRDEVEAGHSGFAHFFEHMMFRGTPKYPGDVYDRIVTSMGADANAYTTDDYTCYHMAFTTPDLPKVIEIEADRFQNLAYAEAAFQTEAGAVYGEYRKGRTQPFSVLFEALQDKAYDVHTYKHTTIGFEKDVAAMPTMYEYSKMFLQRFYRPENAVVVVAGDFDQAKALDLIKQNYGGWKKGYEPPKIQPEPEQKGERSVEVPYSGRTLPIVTVAYKGVAFDPTSKEMAAGMLLGDLAFGETSEIYKELVIEKRLAQRLGANFDMNRDPGLWAVFAMVSDEKDIETVKTAIDAAIAKYRDTAPDAKRLADLKKRSRYQLLMGLDTPDHVAGAVAPFIALSGGMDCIDQIYATMDTVTPADIQAVAIKLLTNDRRTVAVLKGVKS